MNFKSILVLGLGVATLGITLPAHADTASVNGSSQTTIITGNDNEVSQKNSSSIRNTQTGRFSRESVGNSNSNSQGADVAGNRNYVDQKNNSDIQNTRRAPRY